MFDVFRRHQKRMLAAITILAMIAFAFPLGSTYFDGGSGGSRQSEDTEVVEVIFEKKITGEDIRMARFERQVANTFFQHMMTAVYPRIPWGNTEIFGTIRDDEAIKDAIRLSHKADEFGIRVTHDMVRSWINQMTDGRLTNDQFEESIQRVGRLSEGLTAEIVFDLLRKQLRIRQVQSLVTGRFGGPSPPTPYESWQFYRRLNDKLGLEVIPVAVADFAEEVEDPGDAALRELYDSHIDQLPDPASPEPGFREPRRVKVQFASADLAAFTQASMDEIEITDDEIQQYYDRQKELYRIRPSVEPTTAPADVPEKPDTQPDDKKSESDTKSEGASKDGESEGKQDSDTKPAKEPAAPRNQGPGENKKDEPEAQADPQSKAKESDSGDDDVDEIDIDDSLVTASGAPPAQTDRTAENDSESRKFEDTASQEAETKQQPSPGDSPAKTDTEPKAQQEAKDTERVGTEEPKTDSDKPSDEKKEEEKPAPPQYKPIEEVKSEIRDSIAREKARAELIKRLGQIGKQVNEFGVKVYLPAKDKFDEEKKDSSNTEFVPPDPPDFSKLVEELGLKLDDTGWVTLEDLPTVSGIGEAVELAGGRMSRRGVAEVMQSSEYFDPMEFQNFKDEFFVAWKIGDAPDRKPPFEEIRDQVLRAHRMAKARDRARDRAQALAKSLREAGGDVAKLREAEAGIETITIAPMTLWSNAPAYSLAMMSQPGRVEPAALPGIEFPSEELRNNAFQLKEGEVTVAPNQPMNVYYVVLLSKREPASREDFARSRQFIEDQLEREQGTKMAAEWLINLRKESAAGRSRTPAGN